jgi:AraC-like DNA-binding protein
MLQFYKKALGALLVLVVLSLAGAYFSVKQTFLSEPLLSRESTAYNLLLEKDTDELQGGNSTVLLRDTTYSLDYQLVLRDGVEYPFATLRFSFVGPQGEKIFADLSEYEAFSFDVRCTPGTVLSFLVYTLDDKLSEREGGVVHRISETFFSCDDAWREVDIDLALLDAPDWWIKSTEISLSNRDYQLEKTASFAFGTSRQTPVNTEINVKVNGLALKGRDLRPLYVFAVVALVLWGGYVLWFFRQHTRHLVSDVHEKLRKDRPLVAYQQLSIEPQKDRGKKSVLRYMVTEYANPDLSLDTMASELGISRSKINAILKEELGYTFTAYLNKLRLAEAARLLSQESQASVAEIAYSVGYKNVPYFNKLFKSEYGCTPKTFKGNSK